MTIKTSITGLIQSKELKNLLSLNDKFYKNFRILEANVGNGAKKVYDMGHIDKAVYVDTLACSKPSQLHPRALPNLNDYKDYIGSLGISNKHHLILYDRSPFGFFTSVRLWQTFKMMGHQNISVLDGGINNWMFNKYSLSNETPEFEQENYELHEKKLSRDYEDIINNKNEVILDCRGHKQFENTDEHGNPDNIPNSINIPYNELFNPMTGQMKTKDELLKIFKNHHVDLSKQLVTSCNAGMTANALAFALDLVGAKDTAVYFGSWTEYSQRRHN